MRRALAAGVVLVALVLGPGGSEARADEPAPTGLRVAARTGYQLPFGGAYEGSGALADVIAGAVPVRLDIGVRIARHVYVGALVQLAFVVPTGCDAPASCSGEDWRVGIQAAYHLLPTRLVDPWAGIGIGFESLTTRRSLDRTSTTLTTGGFELGAVELGADLRVLPRLRVGPVLSGSLGEFRTASLNDTRTRDFGRVLHGWLGLGVRVAYEL